MRGKATQGDTAVTVIVFLNTHKHTTSDMKREEQSFPPSYTPPPPKTQPSFPLFGTADCCSLFSHKLTEPSILSLFTATCIEMSHTLKKQRVAVLG